MSDRGEPELELDEALHLLHLEARMSDSPLDEVRAKVLAAAAAPVQAPARSPFRKRLVPLAAAAAVLVVGAVVVQTTGGAPAPQPAPLGASTGTVTPEKGPDLTLLSAKQVLDDAAAKINATDRPLADGQFLYVGEHALYGRGYQMGTPADQPEAPAKGATFLQEIKREVWIPKDETAEWLEIRTPIGQPKWVAGSMPESEATTPEIPDTDRGERRGNCGDFFPKSKPAKVCGDPTDMDSSAFYTALPRDPQALFEWLKDYTAHRGSAPGTMFHFALVILQAGKMPADLRGPFYQAIGLIDGVKVVGNADTLDGRTGVALGFTGENERRDLIIDPANGDFIGERTVAGDKPYDPWIKPGTVTEFTSVTTAVVDRSGQVPAK
jgi:hypothetical protein